MFQTQVKPEIEILKEHIGKDFSDNLSHTLRSRLISISEGNSINKPRMCGGRNIIGIL